MFAIRPEELALVTEAVNLIADDWWERSITGPWGPQVPTRAPTRLC